MTRSVPAVRRLMAVALLAGGGGLLAACGSSGGSAAQPGSTVTVTASPSTSAASASPGTSTSAGTGTGGTGGSSGGGSAAPGCATSALKVGLGSGNGAAGSTIVPVQFTNQSGSTCTMLGFPGVSFVTGAGGSQIGAPADRDPATAASLVTLAPGAMAHALLQVTVAQNFPAATCGLTTAHWLKIFPPGQTAALFLKFTSSTCSHASVKVLHVQTVQSGAGSS
jgi:Protein of unknown function (DUF4232)